RLGGDEFVVISLSRHGGDTAAAAEDGLARRIAQATQGRFELPGGPALDYSGPSVGVATMPPHPDHRAEDALRTADRAMYQAKRARRTAAPASPSVRA
ncbi:diguanylate cyclase domain-containing protein, partial [Paracidovorax sp. MALMAid1276]|uniref:diguanylate cyclase domain-containing protein n=1 Tax=Paracidovorax sp. MALMAid1276 TaxID=3411631 RepID=UPI003B9961D7